MSRTFYRAASRAEYLADELPPTALIVAHATVNEAYYAAVMHLDGRIEGYVCATWYEPGTEHPFGYKAMSELEGPYADHCPPEILSMLSPVNALDDPERPGSCCELAEDWRRRCWAHAR